MGCHHTPSWSALPTKAVGEPRALSSVRRIASRCAGASRTSGRSSTPASYTHSQPHVVCLSLAKEARFALPLTRQNKLILPVTDLPNYTCLFTSPGSDQMLCDQMLCVHSRLLTQQLMTGKMPVTVKQKMSIQFVYQRSPQTKHADAKV